MTQHTIKISTGSDFEVRSEDGSLSPLSISDMAQSAYRDASGQWYCPQQTQEKDYHGQVTLGRIGRPVIRYCPVSWLPKDIGDAVLSMVGSSKCK